METVDLSINGSPLNFDGSNPANIRMFSNGEFLQWQDVPLESNGTIFQCSAVVPGLGRRLSNVATVLVQGVLEAVADVSINFNDPFFTISWTAPFTYMIPGGTTYCISITNTSSGSSSLVSECGILNTSYLVELEYNPCVEYSASIIAVNTVGNGTEAEIPFPAPHMVLSDNISARYIPDIIIYQISLPDPVCTCEVILLQEATNCMLNGSTIAFSITHLSFNKLLTVNVTLRNARISTTSQILISSYDIQNIGVNNSSPNAVTLNASYIENSPAMGAVFVLLFIDDVGSVEFASSVYLVLDRVESDRFVQTDISEGDYTVLVFDVESDGRLELGQTSPAVVGSATVSGQDLSPPFPYPPVTGIQNCTVQVEDNDLMVSCQFDSSALLGYLVMAQCV